MVFFKISQCTFFKDVIEKWPYGPVVPSVYNKCKDLGIGVSITFIHGANSNNLKEQDKFLFGEKILKELEEWVKKNPWPLVEKTHQLEGAWDKTPNYYDEIILDRIQKDDKMDFNITQDKALVNALREANL